jgi:signal transduction histidine kinase
VLARLRRGERIDHFETVRQTKDGRQVPISLTVSPIRDSRGHIIGASKVARDITERTAAQDRLKRAHDELEERIRERTADLMSSNDALRKEIAERQRVEQQRTELLTRLVLAQEDERRRIARELHDQLGQQLTALRLTLDTLKAQSMERTELLVQVETLQELARQLDEDVSFRVWELRPTPLDKVGLRTALMDFVSQWSKHLGVDVRLHASQSSDERLNTDVETMVYRLAQEALNNIGKHARAQRVDIALERNDDCLSLIVEDDGVGFDPRDVDTLGTALGLTGMRERAALIGAEIQIESEPGSGTTIILRVPAVTTPLQKT